MPAWSLLFAKRSVATSTSPTTPVLALLLPVTYFLSLAPTGLLPSLGNTSTHHHPLSEHTQLQGNKAVWSALEKELQTSALLQVHHSHFPHLHLSLFTHFIRCTFLAVLLVTWSCWFHRTGKHHPLDIATEDSRVLCFCSPVVFTSLLTCTCLILPEWQVLYWKFASTAWRKQDRNVVGSSTCRILQT